MSYVELHAHSAYSFLDGASQPEELAARAAELGYEALALTDHDGVYGSLEFAHAAKALRRPPDHRRRGDARPAARTSRCSSRRRRATRTSAGCSRRRTRTRGRRKGAGAAAGPALLDQRSLEELQRGARLPLRLRAARARASATRTRPRGSPRAFGRDRFFVELQRPYERGDARRNARSARPRRDARRRRRSRPATCTRTTRAARRSRTSLVAIRNRTSLDGCERERRGNHESVLAAAGDDARALPRRPRRRRAHRRARRAARVRPDRGARLPLPRLLRRRRAGDRPARARLQRARSTSATARANGLRERRRAHGSTRSSR